MPGRAAIAYSVVIFLALSFAAVSPAGAACVSRQADVQSLVAKINTAGLSDFSTTRLRQSAVASSPIQMAYLKFIVGMGSQNTPDQATNCAMALLTRSVRANQNREFVTRVWVDTEGTSYGTRDAGNLASAVGASTTVLHWPLGDNSEAPVDALMR
jgi:hypothetical protein